MTTPGRAARKRRIRAFDAEHPAGVGRFDTLAVEEPLEIRLGGTSYTVTMRTPGHDVELAHGLLAGEGLIVGAPDVARAQYCGDSTVDDETGMPVNTYNVLDVHLRSGIHVPIDMLRASVTTSACGVCGTRSIDLLRHRTEFDVAADRTPVHPEVLLGLPDMLRAAQATFAVTGGLHASGLFTAEGEQLVVREDVGRHNATDKVVGWAMLHGRRPATGSILMVSGRTSFELVQKAALAGIPVIAGVSAPSSLAVELADEMGLTLAGFVRGDRMNVYTHPERLAAVLAD